MASSASSESSLELSTLDNGLFTHALLSRLGGRLPASGLGFQPAAQGISEFMRRIVFEATRGELQQTLVASEGEDAVFAQPSRPVETILFKSVVRERE